MLSNPRLIPKSLVSIGGFCARHSLALFVTVGAACILWTILYFTLLLWAMLSSGGIGGPLAYPVGLLLVFVAATAGTLILLLPATALAEWIAYWRGFPILAQIPVSVFFLALICLAMSGLAQLLGHPLFGRALFPGFVFLFVAHLLPLGVYWWTAQSGPLLLSLVRRLWPRPRA